MLRSTLVIPVGGTDLAGEIECLLERIRLLVELEIQDGKFADFEGVAKQLVAVSEQEPGTLNFKFYLSGDRRRGWWRAVPIRLRLQRTFRARQYSNSFRNCSVLYSQRHGVLRSSQPVVTSMAGGLSAPKCSAHGKVLIVDRPALGFSGICGMIFGFVRPYLNAQRILAQNRTY